MASRLIERVERSIGHFAQAESEYGVLVAVKEVRR